MLLQIVTVSYQYLFWSTRRNTLGYRKQIYRSSTGGIVVIFNNYPTIVGEIVYWKADTIKIFSLRDQNRFIRNYRGKIQKVFGFLLSKIALYLFLETIIFLKHSHSQIFDIKTPSPSNLFPVFFLKSSPR